MDPRARARQGWVLVVVVATLAVISAQACLVVGARLLLDRREQVSDLRLTAATKTFRPAPHPGLAKPLDADAFDDDHNPRTEPARCAPLTALATAGVVGGRSWTGAGDASAAPVTLLTVRFTSSAAARAELSRKRWALLRCNLISVTFPPFDAPAVTYSVGEQRWTPPVGRRARWTLDDGSRRFAFYVVRYGNTLTWTYDDISVSSPLNREPVADDLVEELRDLARQ